MRRFESAATLLMIGGILSPAPLAAQAKASAQAATTRVREQAPAVAPRRGPTDPVELGVFLDGLVTTAMKDHDVVGATVAVVRDGKLMFSKGYGFADFAKRAPVDPATTLFRIGSITKLFTWTAVMQLVEQGKIDLRADVNRYLDFRIPDTYPGHPITMWNLMTHTPGFEDRGFALFSPTTEPRGRFLAAHIPARVRPPGQYSAYSNYGAALAGYIVGRVSGEPWEEYVDRHILEPLGMEHTAVAQPLPKALTPDMSVGYSEGGGDPEPEAFETLLPFAPAGSGSASAGDMARFMIAQLQDGEYEGRRILADSTARLMHTRQFGHDPRLPGFDLGFYQQDSHGVHIIGHGGDTQWFHSDLSLFPADSLGLFVSFNTAGGGKISFGPFLQRFLDHYFPVQASPPPAETEPVDVSPYTGHYELNRMSYTTVEKVVGLVSNLSVTKDPEIPGDLEITTPLGTRYYEPAGENLFRRVDGAEEVAFQVQGGRATHFFLSDVPMMAGERISWWHAGTFSRILLAISGLLFLTAILSPPARWILRKRFPQVGRVTGRARVARRIQVAVAALALASVILFAVALSDLAALAQGRGGVLYAALTMSTLAATATLALVWETVVVWRHRAADLWARIHYTAVAAGAVAFVWVLAQWNLIGWRV